MHVFVAFVHVLKAEAALLEDEAVECPSQWMHVFVASWVVWQRALMVVVVFGQAVGVLMPHDQDVHVTAVDQVIWS